MRVPEYLTTDWVDYLKEMEEDLRHQSDKLTTRADAVRDMRFEFQARMRDHEMWSKEPDAD